MGLKIKPINVLACDICGKEIDFDSNFDVDWARSERWLWNEEGVFVTKAICPDCVDKGYDIHTLTKKEEP